MIPKLFRLIEQEMSFGNCLSCHETTSSMRLFGTTLILPPQNRETLFFFFLIIGYHSFSSHRYLTKLTIKGVNLHKLDGTILNLNGTDALSWTVVRKLCWAIFVLSMNEKLLDKLTEEIYISNGN